MNWKKWLAGIFVVAALSGSGLYWWRSVYPFLELAPGRVAAFTSGISAKATGRIAEMGPQEGDAVKKGDLLFALDRALLMVRKGQIEEERERGRGELAFEQERVQKSLEAYLSEIGAPEEAGQHLLAMQEAQVKIETLRGELARLEEELNGIELQMGEKAYAAPFDGIVLKQTRKCGSVASEGESVYLLANPEKMWVETSLSEQELARVGVGMKAKVRLAAYPDREWKGVVSWIAPATMEGQDRIGVRIAIENPDAALKPGLSASAVVQIH